MFQVQTHWGDVEHEHLHRTLFVFGCLAPGCRDQASRWRVFRCAKFFSPCSRTQVETTNQEITFDNEWGTSADDDWAVADDGFGCQEPQAFSWDPLNAAQSFSSTHALVEKTTDQVSQLQQNTSADQFGCDDNVYCSSFWESSEHIEFSQTKSCVVDESNHQKIAVSDFLWEMEFGWEPPKLQKCSAKEIRMAEEYANRQDIQDDDDTGGSQCGNNDEDGPDQQSADDVFLKFQRRIARAHSQVVRHHLGGKPLWLTKPHQEVIPPCSCGAPRQFELQILPTLIHIIHSRCPESCLTEADFGSLYVYTCSVDCRSGNGRDVFEEFTVTQDTP